jgi:hypothetical protein
MLSSKTGLSLNMAGHYPGGHKKQGSDIGGSRSNAGIAYPQVKYLGPAYPDASGQRTRGDANAQQPHQR